MKAAQAPGRDPLASDLNWILSRLEGPFEELRGRRIGRQNPRRKGIGRICRHTPGLDNLPTGTFNAYFWHARD